ncbi:MAG: imidazolonepropionase-like amidohydrolase [Saprospiraceae bacterium]|jgi:imidazolonepropionase-like amidohydrolase
MKNIFKIITFLTLLLCFQNTNAQVEKSQKGTYTLTNATIETVTNGTISNATLIIKDGKILDLGTALSIPKDAKQIDCSGLTIYPGMIDGGTKLGLSEVGSISLTQDYNEIGDITPHMQALTAVNPNSVSIPITRTNGVTTVITMPAGGILPGTAALINLNGYTPKQMFAGFKGMIVNYPTSGKSSRWDKRSDEDRKKEEEKKLKRLNEVWEQARLYAKIDSAAQNNPAMRPEYNPEMASMLPVIQGTMPILLEVNKAKDIESAIKWVEENKINAIFTGVAEGWRVADELAAAKIPVVTGPILQTPNRASDKYDRPYANAGLMLKAGVKVALRTNEIENVRNLPFNAGFAAAYGMGREEALKAVTIVPAEIFGVADQLGSLEKGKSATLFVTDGDPFETKTQVKYLFIDGYRVAMDSRQIQLYDEFLERTPGVKE